MPRRLRQLVAGEQVHIEHLPWPERNDRFLQWLKHVHDHEGGVVGLDVETTAIDDDLGPFEPAGELRLVQFGSRRYAWTFDPHDEYWRPVIEATLRLPRLRFVSHTNYDPLWIGREFGINLDERSIDTIVMAALLWPGHAPKDLKSLTAKLVDRGLADADKMLDARFTDLFYASTARLPQSFVAGESDCRAAKCTKTSWRGSECGMCMDHYLSRKSNKTIRGQGFSTIALDDPVFATYAGLDAIYVRRLLDELSRLVQAKKMAPLSKREQSIARLCTSIRVRGHRVDPAWTRNLLTEFEQNYVKAEARLERIFGFTPGSPKKGEWLENHGAEFYKFTPKGQPQITMPSASSAGTLPDLVSRYEGDEFLGPIFADLLILGQHKNILTNLRIIVKAASNDGYVHPQIRTAAAHTGRMSIVKPAMQTFKKNDPRLRGCFIARPGHVLVGADYDSQEIRIAAAFSRDPKLLEIVRNGLNMHVVTAQSLFGSKFVDKTSVMDTLTGKTYYDAAKVADFAQQYGAGPKTIGDQLQMKRQKKLDRKGEPMANPKAWQLWEGWRETYAGLVDWTDRMGEQRVVVNPWGRRIPTDPGRGYANGNYMIQSTGRDLLGDAMVSLAEAGWGECLWLPIHDELVLEVLEDEADEACKALEEAMYAMLRDIPMTATANIIGTRWGAKGD